MKPLDDGLLTARVVGSSSVDEDEGGPAAIAIHALYATGPQSPPVERTGRARIRSGGSQGANGTVQRLLMSLFLLVVAGCTVARLFHHDHGSYLPSSWTGSGQGLPSIESMDAEPIPIGKALNETAESTATPTARATAGATASPSASPTFPSIENTDAAPTGKVANESTESTAAASSSAPTASATASPLTEASATASALDAAWTGSGQGPPSIESTDAEPIGKAVHETAESTFTTTARATAPSSAASLDTGAHAEAEAVAALERRLAALERAAEDESPRRKAALLEELLSHHWKADDHAAAADVEQRLRGLSAARFAVGDVVEQLYSAHTLKCRILYPFRVQELHFGRWDESSREQSGSDDEPALVGVRYTIARLSDGMVVRQVPESFLRPYVPYGPATEALCNVGGAGFGEERLLSCRILEYILPDDKRSDSFDEGAEGGEDAPPPAPRVRTKRDGEGASDSAYRVVVRGGGAKEEEAIVPMGRVQRRP